MSVCRTLVVVTLAAAACKGDGGVKDEELSGLVVSPPSEPPAIDPDRAAGDARELARALSMRHDRLARGLGSHTATISARYEVREGADVVEQLAIDTVIEYASDRAYHARADNTADYGREVIWHDGVLYLRPRYAAWHRRPPTDEHEPVQILDEMYAFAGDYFDLVAHAAEASGKGSATVAGRDGVRIDLKRSPSPGAPATQHLTQRRWRQTVTVDDLAGEVVLDADTGAPLEARFDARLTFTRDDRRFEMTIGVSHELAGIGQDLAVAPPPPAEVVDTPERSREVDERDQLLHGMAPPRKCSGGAGATPPPAPPAPPRTD
jgi:hypothetical protein